MGGSETFVETVPGSGSAVARLSLPSDARPASVDAFAYFGITTAFRE